ncbi:MAG: hypothetical protein AB7T06_11070 [Kofleriaceae bacterium]
MKSLLVFLLSLAACQLPFRFGGAAPTRHGFGSAEVQLTGGATATKDLDVARVGGGVVIHLAESTWQSAVQAHADIVLYRGYDRQFILATRFDAGIGAELDDEPGEATLYSFGAFVGPGLAFEPDRVAFDLTWETVAVGFTARRMTVGAESAWFLGAALELGYAVDFERVARIGSK